MTIKELADQLEKEVNRCLKEFQRLHKIVMQMNIENKPLEERTEVIHQMAQVVHELLPVEHLITEQHPDLARLFVELKQLKRIK